MLRLITRFLMAALVLGTVAFQPVEYGQVTGPEVRGFAPNRGFPQIALAGVGTGSQVAFTGVSGKRSSVYWSELSDKGNWVDPVSVSPEDMKAFLPVLLRSSSGSLHCAWVAIHRADRRQKPSYEVFYSSRPAGSVEWSVPRSFGVITEAQPVQLVAGPGGSIYLFSRQTLSASGESKSVLYVSQDDGISWAPRSGVVPGDVGLLEAGEGQLLIGPAGQVMLVWLNLEDGRRSLLFNVSSDGGKTWLGEPVVLNEGSAKIAGNPLLFSNGGSLFVIWKYEYLSPDGDKSEIWINRSGDWGNSWEGGRQLYMGRVNNVSLVPLIGGSSFGCVWTERPPVGDEALKYRAVWKDNKFLEDTQEVNLLHRAGSGAHFGTVNWARSESGSSAAFVCENGSVPGKLWLVLGDGEVGARAVPLGRQTLHHDLRKPVGALTNDGSRLMLVFHEASSIRFFGQPEQRESTILSTVVETGSFRDTAE